VFLPFVSLKEKDYWFADGGSSTVKVCGCALSWQRVIVRMWILMEMLLGWLLIGLLAAALAGVIQR
jgi:hypothetical protein